MSITRIHLPAALALMVAAALPAVAAAQGFDRAQLAGLWAESARGSYACSNDNLHQRMTLSDDGKLLTFKLDRKWRIASGREVEQYSATVLESGPNRLVIRYDAEPNLSREMSEWEMMFIGPGVYRWRSTSWPAGDYNTVVGVRCGS